MPSEMKSGDVDFISRQAHARRRSELAKLISGKASFFRQIQKVIILS